MPAGSVSCVLIELCFCESSKPECKKTIILAQGIVRNAMYI